MTTEILVDLKHRAYEHRRQTLISDLLDRQSRCHSDLAYLARISNKHESTVNGRSLEDVQAEIDANQHYIDLIQNTYNPFTPMTAQLEDAGNIERSMS